MKGKEMMNFNPRLTVAKKHDPNIISIAARHNLRELQAELGATSHIDVNKTPLNMVLAGPETATEVNAQARQLLQDAGITKLRKNAVRMVEVLISLPPRTTVPLREFFMKGLEWIRSFFGVPVLSAIVHLDEGAPHMHVLLLPLKDGRMIGSDLIGGRQSLRFMQDNFHEVVAKSYGFSRPVKTKRLNSRTRSALAEEIIQAIEFYPEKLRDPSFREILLELIKSSPERLSEQLGLNVPIETGQSKSFVAIMTASTRPKNKAGRNPPATCKKPIGNVEEAKQEQQPYTCVGISAGNEDYIEQTAEPIPSEPPLYERVPDDQPASSWDNELGEFRAPVKIQAESARQTALQEILRVKPQNWDWFHPEKID
ncbi:plasmid recombination protein [Chitinimonas lacunae]|uniref:Plasmid recombination protein n=1 Tax=Chitinimonas lacunae TaxID=1963018 RepID=A0ABV8MU88_9NEIS